MKFIPVTSRLQARDVAARLPNTVAVDTEYFDPTHDGMPDARKATLSTLVIATDQDTAYSIPREYVDEFGCLVTRKLFLQNFKADFKVLKNAGLDLDRAWFRDSMLLHHLIDENKEHSLDSMVKEYFDDDYKTQFWTKYDDIEKADPKDRLEYECKDAIYTYRLCTTFQAYLYDKEPLIELVHGMARYLYKTEFNGVKVNVDLMQATEREMRAEFDTLFPKMREEFLEHVQDWEMQTWIKEIEKRKTDKGRAGVPRPVFNFGSDAQLKWLLYQAIGLPVLKRTKRTPKGGGNQPSVDYETFELLAKEGHTLGSIGRYKDIKNIYSTFVVGMINRVEGGRIYPEFNCNGTLNSRISHSNPNLANIPSDGPIRNFFIPDEGMALFGADYDQIEVILEANITGDKNIIKIIREGLSKHDITAAGLGIDRASAKTVNFAMQYRCTPYRIKHLLKCSEEEAKLQWNKYWDTYAGVRATQLQCDETIKRGEPIRTLFGRDRHFSWTSDLSDKDSGRIFRQGYNALIQIPAGDCMNMSYWKAAEDLEQRGIGQMLWTVHDEGLGQGLVKNIEQCKDILKMHMESLTQYLNLEIPLKAKPYGGMPCWSKT